MYEFKDKHLKVKKGCSVWLRDLGIMSLPIKEKY